MRPSVSINIVTYNSQDDILNCLKAVYEQTGTFTQKVIVIDNCSLDNTVSLIKDYFPKVTIINNSTNIGFAAGHNIGILKSEQADYVLTLNPDVMIKPDYVSSLLAVMEGNGNVGMATGMLVSAEGNKIDSMGIGLTKSRRAFDLGQGDSLDDYYENREILGPCAAAALYRREFINDILINGEFFDSDFFIYKEDVDVCWRGQLLGWSSLFVANAVAFHKRGWKREKRRDINKNVRFHSFKNRYLMIIKNDDIPNLIRHIIPVVFLEIQFFIYILLREPYLLKAYLQVVILIPKLVKKRMEIMKKRRNSPEKMRLWFD
ncbi:glycosyltransferase family 2 protein [Brevibacillus migulae]|uniref:glycosyltransferase family 2 protein n=1 Tax=Brevibacillus migulae TaxID=1644114 RepID=UPI0014314775|nr:glycosyltransferase family 2 protein [Brevibacillus migulae]